MPLSNMDSFYATSCGCIHYGHLYCIGYDHLYRIHYGYLYSALYCHLCGSLYVLIIMDSAIYSAVYKISI